jgi:uncharacterized integral membrane protein
MPEVPTRYELAKLSYSEVLDATKHQDDKIGRVLAAIAFFTGGVIAFLDRDAVKARYLVGDRDVPLVAISLGLFLVLAALSALLFVLATSAPLTLPRRRSESSSSTSHLFFRSIASVDHDTWINSWDLNKVQLHEVIVGELIDESHNIAKRVSDKYTRSQEAAALLLIAMPFFVLTVILALDTLVNPTGGQPIEWTFTRRAIVGGSLSLFAALLVYFAGTSSRRNLGWLLLAFPAFIMVTVAGDDSSPWWLVAVAASGVVVAPSFSRLADTGARTGGRSGAQWTVLAGALAVVALACNAVRAEKELTQLAIGAGVLSALPLGNFLVGVRQVFHARS